MAASALPFSIEDLTEVHAEYQKSLGLSDVTWGQVCTKPGGLVLPLAYKKLAAKYYNFQFRSGDIVLLSYLKSGTVWTKEILWAMTHLNELHLADEQHIDDRNYFLDRDMVLPHVPGDGFLNTTRFPVECPGANKEDGVVKQLADADKGSRRLISSHLTFSHLNPSLLDTCKVVYVARNPKDVCLSSYNFFYNLGVMETGLAGCAELFMNGMLYYGLHHQHLREALQHRGHKNLHFMLYEDMKADLMAELRKLNSFLGLGIDDDGLKRVAEHTKFETMKAREKSIQIVPMTKDGSFFHKGSVGGWSKNASQELDAKMDAWIKENYSDIDIFK